MDVLSEFYSLNEIIQMPLDELAHFVAKAGKNRSPNPEKIAEEVKREEDESYYLRADLADSIHPG